MIDIAYVCFMNSRAVHGRVMVHNYVNMEMLVFYPPLCILIRLNRDMKDECMQHVILTGNICM